jgi:hypothetical protein
MKNSLIQGKHDRASKGRRVVFSNFIENKIQHFYFHVESVYSSKVYSIYDN